MNKCFIFFVDSAPLRLCARYVCSFRNFFTASQAWDMTGPRSPSPERVKYTPNQAPRRNAVYPALSGLGMFGFGLFPQAFGLG